MRLYSPVEQRIFGLDLMRAAAILAVLVAHTQSLLEKVPGFRAIPLFDGVDLFFVLSGFLIGGILLRSLRRDGPHVRTMTTFWRRRWLRTLPNYFLFLVLNVAIAAWMSPYSLHYVNVSYLAFAQNLIPFRANHSFFPEAWSLSVEEWFYVTIPLLVIVVARVLPARFLSAGAAVVALFVVALSPWLRARTFDPAVVTSYQVYDDNIRKVVLLRLDTPAIGLLGALAKDAFPQLWRRARFWLVPIGVALVAAAVHWENDVWLTQVTRVYGSLENTMLAVGFLCLLPLLDAWRSASGPLARFVTFTSVISYSLYLVHYSLILLPAQRFVPPTTGLRALLVFAGVWAAAYSLATMNYWAFESRILMFRDRRRARERAASRMPIAPDVGLEQVADGT